MRSFDDKHNISYENERFMMEILFTTCVASFRTSHSFPPLARQKFFYFFSRSFVKRKCFAITCLNTSCQPILCITTCNYPRLLLTAMFFIKSQHKMLGLLASDTFEFHRNMDKPTKILLATFKFNWMFSISFSFWRLFSCRHLW